MNFGDAVAWMSSFFAVITLRRIFWHRHLTFKLHDNDRGKRNLSHTFRFIKWAADCWLVTDICQANHLDRPSNYVFLWCTRAHSTNRFRIILFFGIAIVAVIFGLIVRRIARSRNAIATTKAERTLFTWSGFYVAFMWLMCSQYKFSFVSMNIRQ